MRVAKKRVRSEVKAIRAKQRFAFEFGNAGGPHDPKLTDEVVGSRTPMRRSRGGSVVGNHDVLEMAVRAFRHRASKPTRLQQFVDAARKESQMVLVLADLNEFRVAATGTRERFLLRPTNLIIAFLFLGHLASGRLLPVRRRQLQFGGNRLLRPGSENCEFGRAGEGLLLPGYIEIRAIAGSSIHSLLKASHQPVDRPAKKNDFSVFIGR